jgi:hypothetical protein
MSRARRFALAVVARGVLAGCGIGTFANASDERQWINSGGDPTSPDSLDAGCIQGQLWAASVGFNLSNRPMDVDFDTVIHAIGGRQVQG